MFDEKNHDRTDSLGARMTRLGEQMTPSPQLMQAAATGTPLHGGIRYTAGTHIRKFTKAILLYAACITIFLGALMILPGLFEGNPPVGTQPPAPIDRDAIQNPQQYTDLELEALQTVWTVVKKDFPKDSTINDLVVTDIYKLSNALVCRYYGKHETVPKEKTSAYAGAYRFMYDSSVEYTVFISKRQYDLANAVQNKRITQEDLAALAAAHEQKYAALYDRDTVDHPEQYSEKQLAELKAAWAVIKPYCGKYATINDYKVWNFYQTRDIIICQYRQKFVSMPAFVSKIVAGYTFTYNKFDSELYVFANANRYTLEEAYEAGVLSKGDVGEFWQYFKENNSTYYHPVDQPVVEISLQELLKNQTSVNALIDKSTLHATTGFVLEDPNTTGIDKLFDSVKTEEDYIAGKGILRGEVSEFTCFLFDMKEAVQISAYVITTATTFTSTPTKIPLHGILWQPTMPMLPPPCGENMRITMITS